MSDVEIEAISLTIGKKKLRLKLHEARELYEQLSLMFGNRSSTTYVPVIPPITDDTPTLPKVWCESTNTGVTQ
jgi:hypothetical protein